MLKTLKALFFCLITAYSSIIFPQIKIQHLPSNHYFYSDSTFFGDSETRAVKILNNEWYVYSENDKQKKSRTGIPCTFSGTESLIFEKSINFTEEEVENNTIKLCFLGINNSVEISINSYSIFKKTGSEIPFEVELPKDILKKNSTNVITLKVASKLDSKNTLPLLQRFLFPKNSAGIIRDVFIKYLPIINIASYDISSLLDKKFTSATVDVSLTIKNLRLLETILNKDITNEQARVNVKIIPKSFAGSSYNFDFSFSGLNSVELKKNFQMVLQNPALWSAVSPNYYNIETRLFVGNLLLDEIIKEISFMSLTSGGAAEINGSSFNFQGTTYFINEGIFSQTPINQKLQEDLTLIKNTGFNSVRFAKAYPHPYALTLCRRLGLIALVELPINSVPEEFLQEEEFRTKASVKLNEMINQYSSYSDNIVFGLGSSFLPNSNITRDFINYLLGGIKTNNVNTYASFYGFIDSNIEGLDFYGTEIYSYPTSDVTSAIKKSSEENLHHKLFISEINYPNYLGSASGYLVKKSSEAQAKYFEDIIEISDDNKTAGFFVNTLLDYTGDVNSLYGGFSEEHSYKLGIMQNNKDLNSLPYKVINAKINKMNNVTIPIGGGKDENKLFFILVALGLSVLMAVLINTKKKFREDCSRALFRPYNFFADIRDQRILSGLHAVILMFVEVGSIALLFTVLFYYLRTNIFFEKILLSFGSSTIINTVSYLAWNPEKSLLYLSAITIVKIIALTALIKLGSLFIKTRINFLSIYFTVVWAFLPLTLLLPVELILYKVLVSVSFNMYAIAFVVLFMLWVFQRTIKGIYVIFETRPLVVYFYSLVIPLAVIGGVLVYYHTTNSTVYYIINAVKQFTSLSF